MTALSDWRRFPDGDAATSYLGLTPSVRQSANSCHYGCTTKAGNPQARWLLTQASQQVAQHSGTAGRIENNQIGVFAAYVGPAHGNARTLVDRALYLPPVALACSVRPRLHPLDSAGNRGQTCCMTTQDKIVAIKGALAEHQSNLEAVRAIPIDVGLSQQVTTAMNTALVDNLAEIFGGKKVHLQSVPLTVERIDPASPLL